MPVWYSVPPLWGTCDLIPLAGLLYLDAVSCCFWFSKETRVFSLCGVFWGFGISAENGVFRKNILFDPTPKDFSLPLQKKKNKTKPAQAELKPPTLKFFQLGLLTLMNYSDDFCHRKVEMTAAPSCRAQVTHGGKLCPWVCRLRIPVSHSCCLSALPCQTRAPFNPAMPWEAAQTGRYSPVVKSARVFVITGTTLLVILPFNCVLC